MSYAIESKKRKFERILDSLSDGTSTQTYSSHNTRNNATLIPSFGSDTSKRRRTISLSKTVTKNNTSSASLTTHYLPSSRLAFLERLETFRPITKWHISSTSAVNAAEWAKRGWVCQDTDTVSCHSCKERLHVDIDLQTSEDIHDESNEDGRKGSEDDDPMAMRNAIMCNLISRYQDLIVSAHTETCPWRRRGCDSSIQRIEGLLNTANALSSLEKRYQSIATDSTQVPHILALPSSEANRVNRSELGTFGFPNDLSSLNAEALILAVCGWQKKENDIIECRHCFRSLGLWLYRGEEPTIECLDAIDSHLEYCPWRSEVAQDTELSSAMENGPTVKHKFPGWTLVYFAIVKKNNKGRTPAWRNTDHHADDVVDESPQPQLSPEQREKKMKDLVRRIRDLKRPFNVRSLLKRKDKPQSTVGG